MTRRHARYAPYSFASRRARAHVAPRENAAVAAKRSVVMAKTLQGKKVAILGGSSGIGLAAARAAAADGADVVVTSSRKDKVAAAVASIVGRVTGEVVDLTDEAQTRALFERIGALDHLVFTAGESLVIGPLATADLPTVRRAFELRVFGAMAAVKHAAPRIRGGGSIVLTHGIAGERPQPGWTVGASVCGAMEALTRALAVELAPVRVNAVSPGFVRTPLWGNIPETERESLFREAGSKLPVGRVGEAEEIAEAYLYLMRNGFSTGQTVVVDGGGVLT
jgi:NAD(P)-dependent dehydrogenase (short-subunit alcohol dehydrogenase family)